jgi:hypothetical protein
MQPFSWLLLSDLHLKDEHEAWNQNVVLRDLMRDIMARANEFPPIHFVIVSGDLAYTGKPSQYKLELNAFSMIYEWLWVYNGLISSSYPETMMLIVPRGSLASTARARHLRLLVT